MTAGDALLSEWCFVLQTQSELPALREQVGVLLQSPAGWPSWKAAPGLLAAEAEAQVRKILGSTLLPEVMSRQVCVHMQACPGTHSMCA